MPRKFVNSQKKIILRKAIKQDCYDLFYWVNDPDTRKASLNSKMISLNTHLDWFKGSLKNKKRIIFMALDKMRHKIGAVRFDKLSKNVAEIDINIAPRYRSRGFGSLLLKEACKNKLFFREVRLFVARIKQANVASIKAFKNAGFHEILQIKNNKRNKLVILGKSR